MKTINLGKSSITASSLALGLMRLNTISEQKAIELIETAMDLGINFFEHADIYGGGECEDIFGKIKNESQREKMIIQTKCGIIPGKMFDFSKEHILYSVDKSLKKLKTDYIDILVLHRPDTLVEPEEVSEAFNLLKSSGKVREFGVSNHNSMQIEFLQKHLDQKIIVNQMQFGVAHTPMIDSGIYANMFDQRAIDRDGSTLDYCRLKDITIQAWSPFQYGYFEGLVIDNPKYSELNAKLQEIGNKYGVSKSSIAVAFITRHPAKIQTLLGTMNPERLKELSTSDEVYLTREEWYSIYQSAGNILP